MFLPLASFFAAVALVQGTSGFVIIQDSGLHRVSVKMQPTMMRGSHGRDLFLQNSCSEEIMSKNQFSKCQRRHDATMVKTIQSLSTESSSALKTLVSHPHVFETIFEWCDVPSAKTVPHEARKACDDFNHKKFYYALWANAHGNAGPLHKMRSMIPEEMLTDRCNSLATVEHVSMLEDYCLDLKSEILLSQFRQ